jgi:hypothetical protein
MMPFVIIKLIGLFGWIKRIGSVVLTWVIKDIRNALIVIMVLAAAFFAYGRHQETKRADKEAEKARIWVVAYKKLTLDVEMAAAQFEQAQRDNVERVQLERARTIEGIENAKTIADNDWRTRFDSLRARASAADKSRYRETGLPRAVDPSGKPSQPDHNPGEPLGSGLVAVRINDLETLVQNSTNGRAIQDLVIANERIDNAPE